MADTILLFKCPNCGKWGDFSNDVECECGVLVHEPSDPHSDGTQIEMITLNLDDTVRCLRAAGLLHVAQVNP